jgi:hypothetical protein
MSDLTTLESTLPSSGSAAAKDVLDLAEARLGHSDSAVLRFISFVVADILKETKIRADIDGRVRVGSSGLSCSHNHEHTSGCTHDYTSSLVGEVIDEIPTNHPFLIKIVTKSTVTWSNVLARGERDQAESMDSTTAKFVRRQILTETIVREIVSEVRDRHMRNQKNSSNDGFLFALPQTLREKLSDQEGLFENAISQIPTGVMGNIMTIGYGVVNGFVDDLPGAYKELERMDALGLFEPLPQDNRAVWWTKTETLTRNRPPYKSIASVCERLSYIPFELNSKKKELMVQIVENFQLSVISKDKESQIEPYQGVKFICFTIITGSNEQLYVSFPNQSPIPVSRGTLVVVDMKKHGQINFPQNNEKRFILSMYLTGPL